LVFALLLAFVPAWAQEGEPVVIDEVIAQVNNDVVTLSMLRKASADAIEAFKQEGADEKKATDEVQKRQAEIVLSLIDEQLLAQKAKELNLEEAIEGEINRELVRLSNQYKVKTLEELYELMRRSGVTPDNVRRTLRIQFTRDLVLRQDLYSIEYYKPTLEEVRAYFEKNRDKFKRPDVVELSEIFLELTGKSEPLVLEKAKQIIAEAGKPGADFAALAATYSERYDQEGKKAPSKAGKFPLTDLQANFANAVKNVPAGGVSEPVKTDLGYVILHVDARVAGTDKPEFDENMARQAMLSEKIEKGLNKTYMSGLRKDAYLKVAEGYRPTVDPLLYKDAPANPVADNAAKPNDKKKPAKKDKKNP
jgi:parvulin-like peptidyl-prolyl isomerase